VIVATREVLDSKTVRRSQAFAQKLVVTRAASDALSGLDLSDWADGVGLGLILATDRGDQNVLAELSADFAAKQASGDAAESDLFRAIAYFPNGRVLKNLADSLPARGPLAVMPADMPQARRLAGLWLRCGRAAAVAIVRADLELGTGEASSMAELHRDAGDEAPPAVAVTAVADASGDLVQASTSVISKLRAVAEGSGRVALVMSSMLGSAGDVLYQTVAPGHRAGPDLPPFVRKLRLDLCFSEAVVLVGSSGGTMTGLAVAQDMLACGDVDAAVVCGAESLDGAALQAALGVLHCHDLPHMVGGAVGVLLSRDSAQPTPRVNVVSLDSPTIPVHPSRPANVAWMPRPSSSDLLPMAVDLSAITDLDLGCARQVARHLWPDCPLDNQGDRRSVAADVLELVGPGAWIDAPRAIVAAHSFGGSGVCLMSGSSGNTAMA
jgi:hypothetical protein